VSPPWTLHRGDCLEHMRSLPDKCVDHAIFDAPYEVEAHTKSSRRLKDATQKKGAANIGAVRFLDPVLPFAAITDEQRRSVAIECARLCRRWVMTFCQIEAVSAWRAAFVSAGLDWIRGGVWLKPNGSPQFTGDRPGMGFECIAIAHQPGKKRWNGGGRHAVWECPLDHHAGGGGRNDHPTRKPDDLMLCLVGDFTDEGETVLDPFAGSGTTGVACLRLGRRFIGCELDPKFHELAIERLSAEASGSTLQASRAGQVPLFKAAT
jgi:DNA modification methylase